MTNLHHLHPPKTRAENQLLIKAAAMEANLAGAHELYRQGLLEGNPEYIAAAARALNSLGAWLMEAAREAEV